MNLNDITVWAVIFGWTLLILLAAVGGATWWGRRVASRTDDQAVLEALGLANEDMTAEEFDRRLEAGTPVNIAPGRPTLVVETPFMRTSVTNTEPLWTIRTSSKTPVAGNEDRK